MLLSGSFDENLLSIKLREMSFRRKAIEGKSLHEETSQQAKNFMAKLQKPQIDMDNLRTILTEIDGGRPPLPKDLLWAMAIGDKDKSGKLNQGELALILKLYKKYQEEHQGISALIQKHDKNKDLKLDDAEMLGLLKEAVGVESVSGDDVKRVRVLFDKYSAVKETKGVDPDALAQAISVWDNEANLSEGMFANGFMPGMPEMKLPDMNKSWEDMNKTMGEWTGCCCNRFDDKEERKSQVPTFAAKVGT